MDLDQTLLRLQGALSTFSVTTSDNQKLRTLSLLFRNVDETAKTRMVFFMILNTKMRTTNLLLNDVNFDLVSEDTQNLDFPALSYIIFNLNLVSNLSDIIRNCPAALTVEVLTSVFAYADTRVQVIGLQEVIIGLFEKILKISKGIHREFSHISKLWEFMNIFGDMIWCSSSFQNEELLEEDMNSILGTCLNCVNLYQGNTPVSFNTTYELKILRDKLQADEFDRTQPPDCKTRFMKYICKLLNYFDDVYNTYFKYDPIESHLDLAETAFTLHDKLKNSDIEPSNLSYLDEIRKSPEAGIEAMSKFDIDIIIDKILNGPAPDKWLRALISFPDLTEIEEALHSVRRSLDFFGEKEMMIIADAVLGQFRRNSFSVALRDLYLTCLSKMPLPDLILQFETYFTLKKRPNLENSTIDEELPKFYNKLLTRDVFVKSRILILCIRSPVKLIRTICEQALIDTEKLCYSLIDLKMLKTACLSKNLSLEEDPELDIISSVLCGMIENDEYGPGERSRLMDLIKRLQKKETLDVDLENVILNMIYKEHSQGNYDKMEFALEILKSSVAVDSPRSNKYVLLAFLARLLNQTSWSYSTFTVKMARVNDIIIAIIHAMLNNSKFSANDTRLVWLRNEVMKIGEVNQMHFCELWYSYESELATSNDLYMQLLILINTTSRINSTIEFIVKSFESHKLLTLRTSFTAAFIQILPIVTYRGWKILMTHVKAILVSWQHLQREKADIDTSLVLFRIFTTSLYALAQVMNRTQDMVPCFTYCLRNFGKVIQEQFLTDIDLKAEVAVVFIEELLFVLNGIKDLDIRKEISIVMSPVISGCANFAKKNLSGDRTKLSDLEDWYKNKFIEQEEIQDLSIE